MVRIIYFRDKCIGCAGCVEAAPQRWQMSKKDGKCNLLHSKRNKESYQVLVEDDELNINRIAAKNCPVGIIKVNSA